MVPGSASLEVYLKEAHVMLIVAGGYAHHRDPLQQYPHPLLYPGMLFCFCKLLYKGTCTLR